MLSSSIRVYKACSATNKQRLRASERLAKAFSLIIRFQRAAQRSERIVPLSLKGQ